MVFDVAEEAETAKIGTARPAGHVAWRHDECDAFLRE